MHSPSTADTKVETHVFAGLQTYTVSNTYYSGIGLQSYFSKFFMNNLVGLSFSTDSYGFSTINTGNKISQVSATSLYYLVVDLKTPSLISAIITVTATG
jgi:hypothetical protein